MKLRIIFIIFLLGLINFYAAARVIMRWPWAEAHAGPAWLLALLFFLLQLLGPFGDHGFLPKLRRDYNLPRLAYALDWLSYLALGVMSLVVLYGFVIDIFNMALLPTSLDPARFDIYTLILLLVVTGGTTLVGLRHAVSRPHVKEVEIPIANLPAGFDGFRIAQLSDLHVGPLIGKSYTSEAVSLVNALAPDLVALTGDFIDGTVEDLAEGVAPLAKLAAAQGVFFVTGNHEYYWDARSWIDHFRGLGLRVLLNEHVLIEKNGEKIVLAGVTDYTAGHMIPSHASSPRKAAEGAPPHLPKILLAHQPASYKAAAEAGFDLQLSGHTHAGQYFPFTFLIRYFQTYYKGLNRFKNLWIYVNTGTGWWGPPLKTNTSEITLVILRRGAL